MKKSILAIAILSAALAACSKSEHKIDQTSQATSSPSAVDTSSHTTDHLTAENALDWSGVYKGVLPCADCEGIQTELTLNKDHTFELKETYLGKGDGKAVSATGSFSFDTTNKAVIVLDSKTRQGKYFVGENRLTQLNLDGTKVEGSLAEHYVLERTN